MHFLIVLLVMVMEVVFWYLAKSWIQTWSVHHLSRPVFETSHHRKGTVIDSGTTLGYLAEDAYNPFVDAVTKSVPQSVQPFDAKGYRCFVTKKSVSEVFPTVSFNFAGDASMVLKPENYLLKQKTVDGETAWCIGFQKVKGQGLTILGGKKPVNVSTKSSGRRRISNASRMYYRNSLPKTLYKLTPIMILAFLLHLA